MTETERRLTQLEMALAHAEAEAQTLSEVVRDQGSRLDLLARQTAALARRLAELEESAAVPGAVEADVPPPHW